jgi:hypothetical protein
VGLVQDSHLHQREKNIDFSFSSKIGDQLMVMCGVNLNVNPNLFLNKQNVGMKTPKFMQISKSLSKKAPKKSSFEVTFLAKSLTVL